MSMSSFSVTKIQHFCTKDGPGVRTTVFLQGCPLRCVWCHNPETQRGREIKQFFYAEALCVGCGECASVCPTGVHAISDAGHTLDRTRCLRCMRCVQVCPAGALEACAHEMTQQEIVLQVQKDRAFYGEHGGVTVSGGEPTVYGSALVNLLQQMKQEGISTALETCGYFDAALLDALVPVTDLFLWDVKDTDDGRHRRNTGVSNQTILQNLRQADALGAKTILRCILVKTVNLNRAHLQAVASLYHSLQHGIAVELLAYHTYGNSKNRQLGVAESVHPDWIPTPEEVLQAEAFLRSLDVPILQNR